MSESDCIYKCSGPLCYDVIRICDEGELPTDLFFRSVLPILALVLISEFGIALLLQKMGDYDAMFEVSKLFRQVRVTFIQSHFFTQGALTLILKTDITVRLTSSSLLVRSRLF